MTEKQESKSEPVTESYINAEKIDNNEDLAQLNESGVTEQNLESQSIANDKNLSQSANNREQDMDPSADKGIIDQEK